MAMGITALSPSGELWRPEGSVLNIAHMPSRRTVHSPNGLLGLLWWAGDFMLHLLWGRDFDRSSKSRSHNRVSDCRGRAVLDAACAHERHLGASLASGACPSTHLHCRNIILRYDSTMHGIC